MEVLAGDVVAKLRASGQVIGETAKLLDDVLKQCADGGKNDDKHVCAYSNQHLHAYL